MRGCVLSQGSGSTKPYGEIYVATSRRHYELITRVAELVGTTRSGLVREFMLSPMLILEKLVRRVEELESEVRRLRSVLSSVAPIVRELSSSGAVYLLTVPEGWDRFFDSFISLRGVEDSLKEFVSDYSFGHIDPRDVDVRIKVKKLDPDIRRVAELLGGLDGGGNGD